MSIAESLEHTEDGQRRGGSTRSTLNASTAGVSFRERARDENGNTRAACNQLRAFLNQVDAFINAGVLPPDKGQELIDAAQAVRNQIGC